MRCALTRCDRCEAAFPPGMEPVVAVSPDVTMLPTGGAAVSVVLRAWCPERGACDQRIAVRGLGAQVKARRN